MLAQLTTNEVYALKDDIWNGMGHQEVMTKYKIAYHLAVGIKNGRNYEYVPWPDGSTGKIPAARKSHISNTKQFDTKVNRAINSTFNSYEITPTQRADVEETARRLGFGTNINAALASIKKQMQEESEAKWAKINAERSAIAQARQARYEENPHAPEFAYKYKGEPPVRQDQINPDTCTNELYDWEDVLMLAPKNVVVQMAELTNDPALKFAIRLQFKLIKIKDWDESHIRELILKTKDKVDNYWDAHPEFRPQVE